MSVCRAQLQRWVADTGPLCLVCYVDGYFAFERQVTHSPVNLLTIALHRAIVHCPFPAFSILFTHAVQLCDMNEIARLESFAASLESEISQINPTTVAHPHRLYTLLCKAARLYIGSRMDTNSRSLVQNNVSSFSDINAVSSSNRGQPFSGEDEIGPSAGAPEGWLGEWFHGNQLVMSMLDENAFY